MPAHRLGIGQAGDVVGAGAFDQQVFVPRRQEGMAGKNALTTLGLDYVETGHAVQPLGKRTGKARRHMLGNHDARTVRWQAQQHVLDGFGAASRGANGNQFFGADNRPRAVTDQRFLHGWHPGLARDQACQAGGLDLVANFLGIGLHAFANPKLGFGDKIHRAQLHGAEGGLRALLGQGRDHHHRHRPAAHEFLQKGQAVHSRHFHIQGQHVRVQLLDQITGHIGIRRLADQLQLGVGLDDFLEQRPDQRRIVYHQHFDWHTCPLEQIDIACHRYTLDTHAVFHFPVQQGGVVQALELLDHNPTCRRKVVNLARIDIQQVFGHH